MKIREERVDADLVICGGGIPGVVSAVFAARLGLKTVLINNRSIFGGNGGPELMINIAGATGTQEYNYNARETGIIEEFILENAAKNPRSNRYVMNSVMLDFLRREANLRLFPNTTVDGVVMRDARNIEYVTALQSTTETRYSFHSPLFVDDTGDGTVGFLAGADFRYGREASSEFGESAAPEVADDKVLPSTMSFFSEKRDYPVPFTAPSFALDIEKCGVLSYRSIPTYDFGNYKWFFEICGDLDQIYGAEDITERHQALVYGIWDYIKNSGKYPAENHELTYISPIPGKRESRRIVGDYMLTQSDITEQRQFDDCVGYGGWSIDLHAPEGFFSKEPINRHILLDGIYRIPYRCGYSRDVDNLFIEGRCMSLTHVALGSARVMSTLATVAQANAAAASLCVKYGCTPREVGRLHMDELQNLLAKHDCRVIGHEYRDASNLAESAKLTVSSERSLALPDGDMSFTLNGSAGLSLPIRAHFGGVRLFAKSDAERTIVYRVYRSSKRENYSPDILLYSGSATVKRSDDFAPLGLPCSLDVESGFCFVEVVGEGVELKMTSERLTGVVSSHVGEVAETYIDRRTLKPKGRMSWQHNGTLCFEMLTEESVFGGDNLENGFTYPYVMPNVWHAQGVEGEFVALRWDTPVDIARVTLIFDSYLNEYIKNDRTRECGIRRSIVRDYDVKVRRGDGSYAKIAEVRGNFRRVNEVTFDAVTTDEVRVEFLATNGQRFVSLYAVRVYEK